MQINNFEEAKDALSNVILKHNGYNHQLTLNGNNYFFRNLNYVNNFQDFLFFL